MSDPADLPEPDRIEGAPHPRDTPRLFGQAEAEAGFLSAYTGGRLHHGWLITGPRGVGKATLAWRIARFLLATPEDDGGGLFGAPPPPETLDISEDHPVAARMRAGSEPALLRLTRPVDEKTGRVGQQINVDSVRRVKHFLQMSQADGGRRVIIVDAADEMNVQAANALLKLLEEPPARTVLLLVCHRPSAILPTIRSRCRELRLTPLAPYEIAAALEQAGIATEGAEEALAALAAGSVGEAVRLAQMGGVEMYRDLLALFHDLPRLDRGRALALADGAAARGAEEKRALLVALLDLLMMRIARTGATGLPPEPQAARGEGELLLRLAPNPHAARRWAEAAQSIGGRVQHGLSVNLDPAALILDTVFKIQETAAG